MKKEYIIPKITFVRMDEQPLMAASDPKFNGNLNASGTPANETDVCSKRHTLWDETWDLDNEDDDQ